MKIQSLNGAWQLTQENDPTLIPATVPGCVHVDLIANNLLEDPFYRDNELKQMWIGETAWTYQRTFDVNNDLLSHEQVLLRCHGLDTLATLTLNGEKLAYTDDMFRTYEFDVKDRLKPGENTLSIHFDSPERYMQRMDAEKGEMAAWVGIMRTNSGAWIRKEPCNFGWDWGPKMITSGIWRDIELVAFNTARLTDTLVLQEHESGKVTLTVKLKAERLGASPVSATVEVLRDGQQVAKMEAIPFDGETAETTLLIDNPELWWVAGMGKQPLYNVDIALFAEDGTLLDEDQKRIGLRVLKLERHTEDGGSAESFYFSCNGVPFFAKGANWIPASVYPSGTTRADLERLIQDSVAANMNMLRVWGGGLYESDTFYDLCDEYGIAIWQDFIFACGTYPTFDSNFMTNVEAEARDNVRRIRHHPSLALWCGNNEIEQGMPSAEWKASMSWEDYERLFDKLLPAVVGELDPQRDYWPGSPHSPHGDREDWMNPNWGDTHLWAVWHGKEPFEWYRTRPDRFVSEFGFQSFPEPTVVNAFTAPEDRNITSYVLEHHQRSQIGNSTIVHYMLDWYQLPTSFESMVWLSQILQGMAMKYAVEHWRRNMPRTMGTLYWQLNDMWPAPSWASIDWQGNWKATQYMAKRFYAPLMVSGVEDLDSGNVAVYITSDLGTATDAKLNWKISAADGQLLSEGEQAVSIPERSSTQAFTVEAAHQIATRGVRDVLVWLELWVGDALVSKNLVLFTRPKHLELLSPEYNVDVNPVSDTEFDVTVTTDTAALYVWLELPGARFSDNFFDLQADESTRVRVTTAQAMSPEDFRSALVVNSLVDTYHS